MRPALSASDPVTKHLHNDSTAGQSKNEDSHWTYKETGASGPDREMGPEWGWDLPKATCSAERQCQVGNPGILGPEPRLSTACFKNASPSSHDRVFQTSGQGPHFLLLRKGLMNHWVQSEPHPAQISCLPGALSPSRQPGLGERQRSAGRRVSLLRSGLTPPSSLSTLICLTIPALSWISPAYS